MTTQHSIEVRPATQEDFPGCAELHRLVVRADHRRDFLKERIQAGRMYVALDESRIVGLITFETNFIGCLYVSLLLVHPESRRRGIARRLMDEVARHSKNGKMFSSTEADNEVSIKMHKALGFRVSGYIDNLPQPQRELIFSKEVGQRADAGG